MHFRYLQWDERFSNRKDATDFNTLFDLFQQLLMISGGDVSQSLRWLTDLDSEYNLTADNPEYSIADFIKELEERGYINYEDEGDRIHLTRKTERTLREQALDEIFRGLKRGPAGEHKTGRTGRGHDMDSETRKWQFGDDIHQMDPYGTINNSFKRSGIDRFELTEDDLQVYESEYHTSTSTVLLIDVSHSMILYGEDRITPAKKVAMGLSELIKRNYHNDTLEIIAFGNDAWQINIEDLTYLKVGPYHTNTLAGLQQARHLLHRQKNANKQIFMITDGKPSVIIENGRIYKNSFGLDKKIVNRVLDEAVVCHREGIAINTFMIASDPYLQNFVRELTEANKGRAYYATLDNLGGYVFEDFIRNRRKKIR